ncbi:MAG: NAD-dependent epimerase/dehydratase family protein [Saccharofermentanales bacterium]
MKRILITGKGSYIGVALEKRLKQEENKYLIDTLDLESMEWDQHDFSGYDVVLHVAGIVHVSSDPKLKDLYYRVNRDLAVEVARRAKNARILQFIFLSSVSVYQNNTRENGRISFTTIPEPANFYGDSKLQAERGISLLETEDFAVTILRLPMVYGYGSKGNYPKLAKMAVTLPFFPEYKNCRSIIHIDNLTELIKLIIDDASRGVFYPQNKEHVSTGELAQLIAQVHGKRLVLTKLFNPLIFLLMKFFPFIKKVFGDLYYEDSMSAYPGGNYQIRTLPESIHLTEIGSSEDQIFAAKK